ncbi:MAG: ArsR/SmtB family transcription factor [Opitutales bacterium]
MESVSLFKALSDLHRLRIVSALDAGPLCVCHFEEIIEAEQVKVSKQLRYLKEQGVLKSERKAQWMVYSLAEPESVLVKSILIALQADSDVSETLKNDRVRRDAILMRISDSQDDPLEFIASQSRAACCSDGC